MLVLTGATGKITAVTVWEENIVTKKIKTKPQQQRNNHKNVPLELDWGVWAIDGAVGGRADTSDA